MFHAIYYIEFNKTTSTHFIQNGVEKQTSQEINLGHKKFYVTNEIDEYSEVKWRHVALRLTQ